MAKKVKSGEEYKLLKQKSTPKRIAKILIFLWLVCIILPVMYLCVMQSVFLKEYSVVKGVEVLNSMLQTQYTDLTTDVINKVNIQKYMNEIKIPEIKLDKVSETTQKVEKVSGALAKLGVKNADKVENSTKALQEQVDQINNKLQTSIQQVQKTLETNVQQALREELANVANTQVQKQLGISSSTYQNLLNKQFGFKTEEQRQKTSSIYQELAQAKDGILVKPLSYLNTYFNWIRWSITGIALVILLVPIIIVWWIAKKLSANFTECPYCGKVFLSKAGKFNLLKLFK